MSHEEEKKNNHTHGYLLNECTYVHHPLAQK